MAPPAQTRTTVFVGSVNLVAQIADKLFSFGQIIVIAAFLGATPEADLLFLASIAPLTIGYVVGEPVGRAFLTLLVRERDQAAGRRLAASAFVLTGTALLLVTALYAVVACILVTIFTPGGSGDLVPWIVLSLIAPFAGIAGLLSGMLLWLHDYAWAAARVPIASAGGLILVALAAYTSGHLAWIGVSLVLSYAIAGVLMYARVAKHLGLGWGLATSTADLREASRVKSLVIGPSVGGAIGGQVIVTIERLLAGGIVGTGAVAIISYARGIGTAPTVLAQAVGAASYPRVVRAEAAADTGFLRESFIRGLRLAIFFGAACLVFLTLFGPAAVSAVLERGKFNVATADETGKVLVAFAAATFTGSLIAYLVPFIYGLNRFRAIIWLELAIFSVYVVAGPTGAIVGGLVGLAIGFAIAQAAGVVAGLEVCRRALEIGWGRIVREAIAPVIAPVLSVSAVVVAYRLLVDHVSPPIAYRGVIRAGGGGVVLVLGIAAVLLLSPLPEADQLRRGLRRLFRSE
ncbi:MAG TPA: lipid II flippase MurJ [Gaiellaceae bacterium]|nr:lipid II flippase MurJ [Gaiellaceae bacterium]